MEVLNLCLSDIVLKKNQKKCLQSPKIDYLCGVFDAAKTNGTEYVL